MTQTTEENVIPKGYWKAADDSLVHVSKIKEVDKARDKVVNDLCTTAKQLHDALVAFKMQSLTDVSAFIQVSADEYGSVLRGAAGKGNVTLTSFDGKFKVIRSMQESVAFDERLQVAKSIIDECIHVWSKGANANLKVLVTKAFQTDKQGNVSVGRVLSLRSFEIQDEKWQEAMKAIADSIRVSSSKAYVRFYVRNDLTKGYDPIVLDMAGV